MDPGGNKTGKMVWIGMMLTAYWTYFMPVPWWAHLELTTLLLM